MKQIYVNNIPVFVSPEVRDKIERKEFVEFNCYHEDNLNVSWTRYYYTPFEENNPNPSSAKTKM